MNLQSDDVKRDILTNLYSLLMEELKQFRSTSARLLTGFTGLTIVVIGWVVSTQVSLSTTQRLLLSLGVLVLALISLRVNRLMERYFLDIALVVNRIDRVFGLYQTGTYLEAESMFPRQ